MSGSAEPGRPYRMWGGRFRGRPDPRAAALLESLQIDRFQFLLRWDLLGSLAHLAALGEAHVIPREAHDRLAGALRRMLAEADAGTLHPSEGYEDIHSFIEGNLTERVGSVAGWLHTGRSRNDQVVTAFRLALKDRVRRLADKICELQDATLVRVRTLSNVILPAYTHMQRAQPVLLAHHWLAYFWMLGRDLGRLQDAYRRLDVLPLGSGAIVGSGFPVDRAREAALLGFGEISENSIDATGDRDFVFEIVAALTGLLLHLSRWAGELVLWTTQEFGFASLPDGLATGSSIMPQKKNPDLLEHVRAQAGVAAGPLVTLVTVLKGLPAGYSGDLQEDKVAALTAFRAADFAVDAMTLVIGDIVVHAERMTDALRGGFLTATEVADYLVRRGVPFREAHHLAGEVVLAAEAAGCELGDLPLEAYRKVSSRFDADVLGVVTPEGAVAAKDVPGGTAPQQVAAALAAATVVLAVQRAWVGQVRTDQQAAEARLLAAVPA